MPTPLKVIQTKIDPVAFNALKARAEACYRGLKPVHCPYLGTDIKFTADGWHHLRYDGSRSERPKVIQSIKFRLLLDYAVNTIHRSGNLQYYREVLQPIGKADQSGFRKTSLVKYFAFEALDKNKRIRFRVVIRKIGDGEPHFWSIIPRWKNRREGNAKKRTAGENVTELENE